LMFYLFFFFFFSSRRRHTRCSRDWSSDVCSSDLFHLRLFDGLPKSRRWKVGDALIGEFTGATLRVHCRPPTYARHGWRRRPAKRSRLPGFGSDPENHFEEDVCQGEGPGWLVSPWLPSSPWRAPIRVRLRRHFRVKPLMDLRPGRYPTSLPLLPASAGRRSRERWSPRTT